MQQRTNHWLIAVPLALAAAPARADWDAGLKADRTKRAEAQRLAREWSPGRATGTPKRK